MRPRPRYIAFRRYSYDLSIRREEPPPELTRHVPVDTESSCTRYVVVDIPVMTTGRLNYIDAVFRIRVVPICLASSGDDEAVIRH